MNSSSAPAGPRRRNSLMITSPAWTEVGVGPLSVGAITFDPDALTCDPARADFGTPLPDPSTGRSPLWTLFTKAFVCETTFVETFACGDTRTLGNTMRDTFALLRRGFRFFWANTLTSTRDKQTTAIVVATPNRTALFMFRPPFKFARSILHVAN